ncbi:MAG: hypothetical protein GYA15_14860 [Leptolinea sp.]|jgi:tetratricopeptide (TPR) repeat protein|nr:hypothetical protein [Leptolinea sp.]
MAKKKTNVNTTPEIKPEDTSPVVVDPLYDPLHEGKTMQVRIAPGTTRPLHDKKTALYNIQRDEPIDLEKDLATSPPDDDGPSTQPLKAGKSGKPGRWRWILLGILLMFIGAGAGGWIGYNSAVKARVAEQKNKVALVATTQFQLALVDQANGNLDMARKRLEYIVQLNPQFPGVTEKLTEVMMAQAVKVTPTVVAAEPTPVPTKDTRNTEELFVQARQQAANKEWNAALTTLDNLRQIDRSYRAVQTDGLYYIALRNRGINRINSGMLEQGIYDITMASQFGPLDKEAVSYTQTASYYLSGVAAWAVDWPKVLEFFSQFYATAPGLRDASGMTAAERYRKGSILYGDELVAKGDPCSAVQQYQNALALSTDDVTQSKLNEATNQCTPPTEEVQPTEAPVVEPTMTPSPDPSVPVSS